MKARAARKRRGAPHAASRRRAKAGPPARKRREAPRAASRRRAEAGPPARLGFTLLEVLVAVAVFGLVYVTVARVAIQGMQSAGDASRRLEASLLADRALGEVEAEIARGQTPRLGEQTREEGPYRVEVAVEPFSPESVGLASALAELDPPRASEDSRRPGESTRRSRNGLELGLLQPPRRGAEPALLQVSVRVAWEDAARERSVERTTFALDRTVAATRLEGVARADEAGEESEAEPEESESEVRETPGSGAGAPQRGPGSDAGENRGAFGDL